MLKHVKDDGKHYFLFIDYEPEGKKRYYFTEQLCFESGKDIVKYFMERKNLIAEMNGFGPSFCEAEAYNAAYPAQKYELKIICAKKETVIELNDKGIKNFNFYKILLTYPDSASIVQ